MITHFAANCSPTCLKPRTVQAVGRTSKENRTRSIKLSHTTPSMHARMHQPRWGSSPYNATKNLLRITSGLLTAQLRFSQSCPLRSGWSFTCWLRPSGETRFRRRWLRLKFKTLSSARTFIFRRRTISWSWSMGRVTSTSEIATMSSSIRIQSC